jgi:hypothetical protein
VPRENTWLSSLRHGNAVIEVIGPAAVAAILGSVSAGASDASLVLRITAIVSNAWFDAIAPYHPTAVGVYSRLGRRPAAEAATHRNRARPSTICWGTTPDPGRRHVCAQRPELSAVVGVGAGLAAPSVVAFYLSKDLAVDAADVPLSPSRTVSGVGDRRVQRGLDVTCCSYIC